MSKVLVVGASGQLGSAILNKLEETSLQGIAFIRSNSKFNKTLYSQVEVCIGNLSNSEDINFACSKANFVIATASAIVPRKGDKFGVDEITLYQNLIDACQNNKIEHLIYISAFSSPFDHLIPEFRIKRKIEELIINSGVPYTIFRCAAFMDIYYAVMGSNLVLQKATNPTMLRCFWFTQLYHKLTNGILEKYGIAIVPGNGKTRQSFICVNDVAAFMVKALTLPNTKNRTIQLGGHEAISWNEVANIYSELLNKSVKKIQIPIYLLKSISYLLKPFSPASENTLFILTLLGGYDNLIDMKLTCQEFDLNLKNTHQYVKDCII